MSERENLSSALKQSINSAARFLVSGLFLSLGVVFTHHGFIVGPLDFPGLPGKLDPNQAVPILSIASAVCGAISVLLLLRASRIARRLEFDAGEEWSAVRAAIESGSWLTASAAATILISLMIAVSQMYAGLLILHLDPQKLWEWSEVFNTRPIIRLWNNGFFIHRGQVVWWLAGPFAMIAIAKGFHGGRRLFLSVYFWAIRVMVLGADNRRRELWPIVPAWVLKQARSGSLSLVALSIAGFRRATDKKFRGYDFSTRLLFRFFEMTPIVRPPKPELHQVFRIGLVELLGSDAEPRDEVIELLKDPAFRRALKSSFDETWDLLPLKLDVRGWIEGLQHIWLPTFLEKFITRVENLKSEIPHDDLRLATYKWLLTQLQGNSANGWQGLYKSSGD